MTRLMFFYGTLMGRGGAAERAGLRLVGPGRIRGDMFSVDDAFPAFVDGRGEIVGEVWEAPSDEILRGALHVTDSIEGYREERPETSMYLREERPLLDDGRSVLVYRWNRRLMGPVSSRVPGGDWRAYTATLVRHRLYQQQFEDEQQQFEDEFEDERRFWDALDDPIAG